MTGYRVERCQGAGCTSFAQIATPTTTTYSDTGLAAGSYSYRVRATDAAGNLSPYSNVASASNSGHATADGAEQSDGDGKREPDQSELDGIDGQRGGDGISGGAMPGRGLYELCTDRDAGRRRHTATRVWRIGSYSYRVRATDAAGNLSAYSNVASASDYGHAAADGAERI